MYEITDKEKIEAAEYDLESALQDFKSGFYSSAEGTLRRVIENASQIKEEKYQTDGKVIKAIADAFLFQSIKYDLLD